MNIDTLKTATHIKVQAGVRYWDDAEVNGSRDHDGSMIPLRVGEDWCPTIRLEDGAVMNWPVGTTASIHYKVCDAGSYWLLNDQHEVIASRENNYVPDLLTVGSAGFGDYIILNIDTGGLIEGWKRPELDLAAWRVEEG